jgi:hypothetical protein
MIRPRDRLLSTVHSNCPLLFHEESAARAQTLKCVLFSFMVISIVSFLISSEPLAYQTGGPIICPLCHEESSTRFQKRMVCSYLASAHIQISKTTNNTIVRKRTCNQDAIRGQNGMHVPDRRGAILYMRNFWYANLLVWIRLPCSIRKSNLSTNSSVLRS